MVNLHYPAWADNEMKKMYFLYRVQRRMREHHNDMGKKFRNGQISQQTWNNYKEKWNKWHHKLMQQILKRRKALEDDETAQIDLEEIFSGE